MHSRGCDPRLLHPGRIGAGRRNIDLVQRPRILPVARRDLHDDVILVERIVDGRNLTLAEGVIERVVDGADRETEPHRGVAIDREVGLEAAHLLIGIDVLDDVVPHQRLGQLGRPGVELRRIVGEQRILVGRVALPPSGSQVRHRDHEEPRARDLRKLATKPGHDLVGGDFALVVRLQRDVDETPIRAPSSGETDDTVDGWVVLHDGLQLGELGLHRLKGDALIALDRADDEARVLHRKQAVAHLIAEHVVVEPDRGE